MCRRSCVALWAVAFGLWWGPVSAAESAYQIQASSFLGGSGDDDAVLGIRIRADGTIVLAANLAPDFETQVTPDQWRGEAGNTGAILRLSADGQKLLSLRRIAAEVKAFGYDGQEKWTNYDWSTDQNSERFVNRSGNNMADTRAYRCTLGRDGKLDLMQQLTGRSEKNHCTNVRMKQGAIAADEDGRVFLAGWAQERLPIDLDPAPGQPLGGPFLLGMTPGLRGRLVCTRMHGQGSVHALDVRRIGAKVMVVYGGSGAESGMFVQNAFQKAAKGKDGFFVILGNE